MKRFGTLLLLVICGLLVAAPRWSQSQDKPGPGRARVTMYRIAAGRHLDFLKWMAAQDEVAKEAGFATVQFYAHINGDDWDFIGIAPVTTPEQEKLADEIATRKGLKTGLPASFEFRDLVTSHSDTFVAGPMSAAELIAQTVK